VQSREQLGCVSLSLGAEPASAFDVVHEQQVVGGVEHARQRQLA
jgi:hypothetical protein